MTTPPRRPALGRGLSALIPGAPEPSHAEPGGRTIPLRQIHPATTQPRTVFDEQALEELAASIREHGLLQPVVVRQTGPETYAIIAGERRWRAAARAGLQDIPVVLREATDARAFELALIENVQRADLGPLEEAEAYHHLVSTYHLTQEEVARRVGKDRATVANAIRLLRLPTEVRTHVAAGRLTAGHARAILTAPDEAAQVELAAAAAEAGWSVRETERRARERAHPPEPPPIPEPAPARQAPDSPEDADEPTQRNPATEAVEAQLRASLGAPVRLVHRGGAGRIEVRFHSYEELDRLLDLISTLEGR